ncbi:MAG: alpha/beta hydrolase [Lachnospiraceae bacterium]|nr:alpha/beta hydrolase [Lachnospiraceae bacterium]
MKQYLNVTPEEKVIGLGSSIVYGNRTEWCGATWRPLELSLMRSRQFFYYDEAETLPVIVFFCGGGFTNVDHNVWMPELAWFAKRGYAVVSVHYSVTARTRFPMQLEDAKLAIRYLRAHREELRLDTDRMIAMGESAGGYLCGLVGLTGKDGTHDVGEYPEYSSEVSGVVSFYPVTDAGLFAKELEKNGEPLIPPDMGSYPGLAGLVSEKTPPFMLLHGTADSQVPVSQSELLYEALAAQGVRAELYIVEGAEHADAHFFQPEMKERILAFMDSVVKAGD